MATHSSFSILSPLVTLVVSLREPLSIDSPLFDLRSSSYPATRVELLLVHETRSLTPMEVLKKLPFRTIKSLIKGSRGAFYPQVAKAAKGQLVLFLNGDCRPSRTWIREMVAIFQRDKEIGLALGETQWRSPKTTNKIGKYCEQIGFNSAGLLLQNNEASYLSLEQRDRSLEEAVDPIVPLLEPVNLGMRIDVLRVVATSNHSLDKGLTWEGLKSVKGKQCRLFYEPGVVVEQCPDLMASDFYRLCSERAERVAAWARFRPEPRLRLALQFWGRHELVLPFPVSVDVSWGDFHWIHLWGMLTFWQVLWLSLFSHSNSTAWDTDMALFEGALWGVFLFRYFSPLLKVQPWTDFILWCWLRYRSNMSMFCAGILASFKFRCFQWMESW